MFTLTIISWVFLGLALASCVIVFFDINMGRYQAMPIMNIIWPLTALYMGVFGVLIYFMKGRAPKGGAMMHHHDESHEDMACHADAGKKKIKLYDVFSASTHCAAGCVPADIISEILIFFVGVTIFGYALYASFFIDYAFAFAFGFIMQYFTLKPMKPNASLLEVIVTALKADVVSLTCFQIGMYATMLGAWFLFDGKLAANMAIYWFVILVGMNVGLLTTMPVNWLLIRVGWKKPCAH